MPFAEPLLAWVWWYGGWEVAQLAESLGLCSLGRLEAVLNGILAHDIFWPQI